jgi:hypothetical protein
VSATIHVLEEFRKDPHLVFPTIDGNVTVISVALIDQWIAGEVVFSPEDQILLRSIIKDWKARSLGM